MRINDLSIDHMRAVIAVATEGGFTAAADQLDISQSSLSRTVAQVERATKTKLFQRTTRKVELTSNGVIFVESAQKVVEHFDRAVNNIEKSLIAPSGQITIATLPSLAATLIPNLISKYHNDFPNVSIKLLDLKAHNIVKECKSGNIDFAITAEDHELFTELPHTFRYSPIAEEDFACILPSSHPLKQKQSVEWNDLSNQPFISFTEESSVRRLTDKKFSKEDFKPSQVISAGTISAVAGLCAAGLGMSAVPGFVIPMTRIPGVIIRPFPKNSLTRSVGILQDSQRVVTPAMREFLNLLERTKPSELSLPQFTFWNGLSQNFNGN